MTSKYQPLNKYEKDLIESIKKGEFVEAPNQAKEIKKLTSYFKEMPRKDVRITIRVNKVDLDRIKMKAVDSGVPYQTIISALLRQFAKDKINITI